MSQDNIEIYAQQEELEEELNINLQKIWNAIWSRKDILIKVFCYVLLFFILLTFILPKKYKVTADLYINKSNNSNMVEVNPYVLDETSGSFLSMGSDKVINNEMELMKSALVLDNVIRENHIVYKKIFGIFPNKKEGELMTAKDFYKKGKILKINNVKNTSVISIEFTNKKPEVAYGVVSSLINNYIALHKQINSEKSKFDKELLELEYDRAKEALELKLKTANGIPAQTGANIATLSAMSAYSTSANKAINSIKQQYLAGERTQVAVTEEVQKLTNLGTKLEWAKMVEQLSDSSKVLVLNEPIKLRPFEKSSPKLLTQILLGIVFGFISAIIVLVYLEITDRKLAYSMLSNNIIYDASDNFDTVKTEILGYSPKKVLLVALEKISDNLLDEIKKISNAEIVYADLSSDFVKKLSETDKVMLILKIGETNSDVYKKIKSIIKNQRKELLYDVLI